jgi:hypothetical protein
MRRRSRREYDRTNPTGSPRAGLYVAPGPLSTGEKVGLVAAGAAVLGIVGYLIYKSSSSTAAATPPATTANPTANYPVVQTPIAQPPNILAGGPVNPTGGQIYDPNFGVTGPTSETTIGGQVYDPNLGGSGAIMPSGG